jgi:hypothetical protein
MDYLGNNLKQSKKLLRADKMKSETIGKNISKVEVTNISSHGIWILTENEEMFLSYEDFPWFKDVSIKQIVNIQEIFPDHYYWPDLDIDLSKAIIINPERFPMKALVQK